MKSDKGRKENVKLGIRLVLIINILWHRVPDKFGEIYLSRSFLSSLHCG